MTSFLIQSLLKKMFSKHSGSDTHRAMLMACCSILGLFQSLPRLGLVDDSFGKAGEKFCNMTISVFRRYVDEKLYQRCAKDVKEKGKKWAASSEDSNDEDSSGPSQHVKKGKGCHVLDSSDLNFN